MNPLPEGKKYRTKIKRLGRYPGYKLGCPGKTDPKRTRHETGTAYNAGCRCEICLQTNRTRTNKSRWARIALKKSPPAHGYTYYVNWGCRCDVCCTANKETTLRNYYKRKNS